MNAKKMTLIVSVGIIYAISFLSGCASPKGSTGQEKRAYVQNMRSDALSRLYDHEPDAKAEIAAAPGYAVFEAVRSQVIITTMGNAYGIVHDNETGKDTYMSSFTAGAGFGAGIKDYRAVVVFKDRDIMDEFVNKGWVFGASGTADAKTDTSGGSASTRIEFDKRLKIYTFTEQGLMAGASLKGTKVWKDEKLN
ncbi:MAG: YSC84-related protein [Xanthomonadales bacterium]|jgi:lipid-binding SYLF domain-containing protein|nr:YSC84-related protein [Xanthomonadales bacterium]